MITIVDYGTGNVGSIASMIKKAGGVCQITNNNEVVKKAVKLILPGVGSFDSGMKNLHDLGLIGILNKKILEEKIPILGICLGMQLMCKFSEEGELPGLNWVDASAKRFNFLPESSLKVPHMGWNTVKVIKHNSLISMEAHEQRFYFAHSYHAVCNNPNDVLATAYYGYDFTAAFSHENIFGVQFHPEKSHRFGMELIKNFVEL